MTPATKVWLKVGVALALVAAGGFGAWVVRDTMAEAEVMTLKQDHERASREALDEALRTQKQRFDEERERMVKLAEIDKAELAKMKGTLDENNRLRECLRTGTCGLRVRAICPAAVGPSDLPPAQPGAGVDTGRTAELDGEARQAYLALRDGIAVATSQLRACQSALKNITGQ